LATFWAELAIFPVAATPNLPGNSSIFSGKKRRFLAEKLAIWKFWRISSIFFL
jgi:hypothetical protein